MASIVVSGDTSGAVTLSAPSVAGTTTVTLPSSTGTMALLQTPSFATTIGVGGATASASGSGISFPATQSASSDANTLDDYEEGAFTPSVGGGITSPTYSKQVGVYTKIGNFVHIQISIETNGGTRNVSALKITGLPFTQGNFNGGVGYTYAYVNNVVNSTTINFPTAYGDESTSNISFYKTDSSSFVGNDLQSSSFRMDITGSYRV